MHHRNNWFTLFIVGQYCSDWAAGLHLRFWQKNIYQLDTINYQIIAGVFICFNYLTDQAFIWDQVAIWDRHLIPSPQKLLISAVTNGGICLFAIVLIILQDALSWRARLLITQSRMCTSGSLLAFFLLPPGSLALLLSSSDRRWSSVWFLSPICAHVFFLDVFLNKLDSAFIWNQRLIIKIYTCIRRLKWTLRLIENQLLFDNLRYTWSAWSMKCSVNMFVLFRHYALGKK